MQEFSISPSNRPEDNKGATILGIVGKGAKSKSKIKIILISRKTGKQERTSHKFKEWTKKRSKQLVVIQEKPFKEQKETTQFIWLKEKKTTQFIWLEEETTKFIWLKERFQTQKKK
jgi:hypothetical protein